MSAQSAANKRKSDAKKGLVRFELTGVHPDDKPKIKRYADRLRKQRQGGMK